MKNKLFLPLVMPLLALAQAALLTACTNSFLPSGSSLTQVGALPSALPIIAGAAHYTISSVQVAATASSSSSATPSPSPTADTTTPSPPVTILFDPTRSSGLLSDSCTVAGTGAGQTSAKPCACQFQWTEANNTGSSQVNIPHSEVRPLTGLQSNLALCLAPRAWGEVDTGTVVKISVVPFGTSAASFSVPVYNFTKTATNTQGSFQDAQGSSFSNIHRYSCYQTTAYPKVLTSFAYKHGTDSGTLPLSSDAYVKELFSSAFCVKDANSSSADSAQDTGASSGSACATITAENSNQAAFYNLYIRATDRGQVNTANVSYTCPKINESLNGTGLDYWPMDTTFALSISNSSTFNLGVEAFSKISNPNDPANSVASSCVPATGAGAQIEAAADSAGGSSSGGAAEDETGGSLLKSCIGFAAQPNADGTCPYFKTPQGTIRPTFRLRRFMAIYPPLFSATGRLLKGRQSTDMIYVLDRPVAAAGSDPNKPYSMRGPKPCPFSYYDEKGVLSDPNDADYPGGMPGYAATNYPGWNGTNVDGIEFPNKDIVGQSCSASLPILNENKSRWSVTTLNRRNPVFKRLFVRPIRAWSPHYMEDTDFQACAPLADPLKDPPLHFSKDPSTGNVAWCAEAYPTQNTNVTKVDRIKGNSYYPGKVLPFTSHVVKNAAGSACQANPVSVTSLGTAYPPNPTAPSASACTQAGQVFYGTAHHPNNYIVDVTSAISGTCNNSSVLDGTSCNFCAQQTCDRTVATATLAWSHFPLLARPAQVESAMAADSTYGCVVTYDNGGGKAGKTTPTEGCCGAAVRVWTGFDSSLTPNPNKANTSAHLEPNQQCLVPNY